MRQLLVVAALVTALAGSSIAADVTELGDVMIHQPWARASLGATPNSAAYMRLETAGAEADRLVGGSTPVAEEVQLHTHIMEGGVAKMRPVEAIEVAPGETTVLEPGGLHVMLMGLTQKLEEGNTMPLTLLFENAGEVTLDVPIKGIEGMGTMGHGGHGGSE